MPWFFSSKTFQASGFIISLSLFSPFFLLSWNELCASGMPSFRLRQTVALLQLTRYLNIPLLSMFRETPYLRGVCVCLCVCVCVCVCLRMLKGLSLASKHILTLNIFSYWGYFLYPVFSKYRIGILGLSTVDRNFNLLCSIWHNFNTCGHLKHFSNELQKGEDKRVKQ